MRKIWLIAEAAAALAGCREWQTEAPVETTVGQPDVTIPVSRINLPVAISTDSIADRIEAEFRDKHLASGRTDEINARLLVDRSLTGERIVRTLVSPEVPRQCAMEWVETQVRRVRNVRESFSCLLSPWRWGTYGKDGAA